MNNRMKKYFPAFFIAAVIIIISFPYLKPMIVMSGSMEPELKTGSLCFINTRADYVKIKEKDIVTYRVLDSYVTHRVKEVTDQGLITKGDSNNTEDLGIVTEENFYGKMTGHIPYAGYVLFYIRKNALLLIAAFIVVYFCSKSVGYTLKRIQKK